MRNGSMIVLNMAPPGATWRRPDLKSRREPRSG
jgi:hypothetical protein